MTTSQPVRWGILSTAGIGLRRVIPVLQQNPALMEVRAIASRQHAAAEAAAQAHGIAVAHGSYEALRAGEIGTLRFMQVPFGYFNTDAANIRNRPEAGGGDFGRLQVHHFDLFGVQPPVFQRAEQAVMGG